MQVGMPITEQKRAQAQSNIRSLGSSSAYAILTVEADATGEEITRAYRQLAKQLHPDRNPSEPDAAERFERVQTAYELLGDPEIRKLYDQSVPITRQASAEGAPTSTPESGLKRSAEHDAEILQQQAYTLADMKQRAAAKLRQVMRKLHQEGKLAVGEVGNAGATRPAVFFFGNEQELDELSSSLKRQEIEPIWDGPNGGGKGSVLIVDNRFGELDELKGIWPREINLDSLPRHNQPEPGIPERPEWLEQSWKEKTRRADPTNSRGR
jgi:hypothetical protein